jgi:hypothetical protein
MRSAHACLILSCAALALPGCTVQQSSSTGFQGAERDVAQVVDDLKAAGRRRDGDKVCTRILSQQLAEQLANGSSSCADEVKKAIDDAGDFDLEVRDVTISGTTARAQVRQKGDGRLVTLELAREGGGWRLTSLG